MYPGDLARHRAPIAACLHSHEQNLVRFFPFSITGIGSPHRSHLRSRARIRSSFSFARLRFWYVTPHSREQHTALSVTVSGMTLSQIGHLLSPRSATLTARFS